MRGAAAKCIPVELDRWGYGRPVDGLLHEGRRSLAQARRAARACPNGAISFTVEEMARTT